MQTENPESQSPAETPAPMSLTSRLANVYAAPSEVFDGIRGKPVAVANWLVPVLLAALVGVVNVWIMFSTPALVRQMEEMQEQRYAQMVEDGKLSQEQADQIQERVGGLQNTIARIAGTVGALVGTFFWLFLLSLVFFLMMRWVFRAPLPFMKTVEVLGLSTMVAVLGSLVTMLLMVITGNMFANLGPALLISDIEMENKLHLLASSVNLFTLWWLGVVALGLARVSFASFAKLAFTLYGLWALLRLAIVFSGLGASGM